MSHLVKIECVIKDLDACRQTSEELGLTWKEGQKNYRWWGSHVGDYPLPNGFTVADLGHCEHAIGVPGTSWEIGVAKLKDGSGYTLLFDFYGSDGLPILKALAHSEQYEALYEARRRGDYAVGARLESECAKAERFAQTYSANALVRQAQKRGLAAVRSVLPDGRVEVLLRGRSL